MDQSIRASKIFLAVFAIALCGLGVAVLLPALRNLRQGGPLAARMFTATVFGIVGLGLVAVILFASKRARLSDSLRREHPEQPWLWREDWSHGRSNSKTKSSMISAWAMATIWMLVCSPILFLLPKEQFQRQPRILFALLFPAIGVFLLGWAVRETMRWLEFGKTYFEMPIVPLVVGRELRGTIQARFSNLPDQGVQLKLSCVRRSVTGSGKNRSVQEKILWRDEKLVPREALIPGPIGTSIPASFSLPADAAPTNPANPRDAILWLLEADAAVPGVDYMDIFEVPVFHTKDSPALMPAQAWSNTAPTAPVQPTILVRPAALGGTEFYFPPARNIGFAAGATGFTLVWGAIIVFMVALHAPFIFPLAFGLFEALLIFTTLELWVGTSSVVIGSGTVTLRSGLFGLGQERNIPCLEVLKLQTAITAQQGGGTGTPYYDIQLITTAGAKITLGKSIREKHEADWLVWEMEQLANVKPLAMSAAAR